jgi:RNA polymerase sigma factor (sigma-70 family)
MADVKTPKPTSLPTTKRSTRDGRSHDASVEGAYLAKRQHIMNSVRRRGGTREDQEDAAQVAAVKTLSREKTEPIGEPEGYLYAAAKHAFTDIYNEQLAHAKGCKDLSVLAPVVAPSPEDTCMIADLLIKAMAQLSPEESRAVKLVMVDGLTREQAAKKMGITARQVRTLLAGAVERCIEAVQTPGESK